MNRARTHDLAISSVFVAAVAFGILAALMLFATVAGAQTECVTPDGYPYTTSYDTCPPSIEGGEPLQDAPAPLRELPATGVPIWSLVALGAILTAAGLGLSATLRAGDRVTAVPPVHTPRLR